MDTGNGFLTDIEHSHICGDGGTYCGHPRVGGIANFGGGEVAFLHQHSPCDYATWQSVSHSTYPRRGKMILMRSFDGGRTWPADQTRVVFDHAAPLDDRRAALAPEPGRATIDLAAPDTMCHFGQTFLGPDLRHPEHVCFLLRSADRGNTWEHGASRLPRPDGQEQAITMNHPPVRMPDNTWLIAVSLIPANIVALYGSDDDGETWEYLSCIARDPTGLGRPTYGCLLLLPDGTLQCYTINIHGLRNAMQLQTSADGGYSWSTPRPIVRIGDSPWAERPRRTLGRYHMQHSVRYRSPWPMLLADGRILVVFARRKPPLGIGAILSEDGGATWSREAILRDDATSSDIGYPVCTQLDDSTVFTAYYYVTELGGPFGGPRFIAGSHFRVT